MSDFTPVSRSLKRISNELSGKSGSNILDSGLCYAGANFYTRNDALVGSMLFSYKNGLNLTFTTRETAPVAPAALKKWGDTPEVVGGNLQEKIQSWPLQREAFVARGRMGLQDSDAARLMLRSHLGVLTMVVSALTRGEVAFEDGTVIDIWDGAEPIYTAELAWDELGSKPLNDIFLASDAAIAHEATAPNMLFLSSSAARAFMTNSYISEHAGLMHSKEITIDPRPMVGVTPVTLPGLLSGSRQNFGVLAANFIYPDVKTHYNPRTWQYIGELAGVQIYRDIRGIMPAGEGLLLSPVQHYESSRAVNEGESDYTLFWGGVAPAGQPLSGDFLELALYVDRTPDGASLHSYCSPAIGVTGSAWGAISLRGLVSQD